MRAQRASDPRVAEADDGLAAASSLGAGSGAADLGAGSPLSSRPSEAPTVVARVTIPVMGSERAAAPQYALDEAEEDDNRTSGERPVDAESMRARPGASELPHQRPDLSGMSIPPPPRVPSFARLDAVDRESSTLSDLHSASLLDAPPTLRPSAPDVTVPTGPSPTLLAFVGVFSAIIVTAGLVALRELTRSGPAAKEARAAVVAPANPAAAETASMPASSVTPAPAAAPEAAPPLEPMPRPSSGATPRAAEPARTARPKKPAPGRALVAKATDALRQLTDTSLKSTLPGEPAPAEPVEAVERLPNPDEPLELPVNPY